MKIFKIVILYLISLLGIFYGLGEMVNKKYNVDELYWQAENKTSSEQEKQNRIKQLDECGRNYTIKYTTSFAVSIFTLILGTILIMKKTNRK